MQHQDSETIEKQNMYTVVYTTDVMCYQTYIQQMYDKKTMLVYWLI